MGTCIQFHYENLPILLLYATMKIKEIIHIIFSSHCVSYSTYQDPRVTVDTSGNLILCCKPQICCLALRGASHILESRRVDSSFWKKGDPSGWAFGGLRLV